MVNLDAESKTESNHIFWVVKGMKDEWENAMWGLFLETLNCITAFPLILAESFFSTHRHRFEPRFFWPELYTSVIDIFT